MTLTFDVRTQKKYTDLLLVIIYQLAKYEHEHPLPTNVDILLSGCPLYDNDGNKEIFGQVHNFIIHRNRFS